MVGYRSDRVDTLSFVMSPLRGFMVPTPRPRGRGKGEGLLALSFPHSNNPALSEHNPRLLVENRPLLATNQTLTPFDFSTIILAV